ncbi:MAG: GNAT family N-acetyltransferase [Rhizobiales bacterium]|jgi:GNAT superfamily N-acetyltransferase|nr:GNAT family N-acetyltransferase [Hyphomicrobiales bacterium]
MASSTRPITVADLERVIAIDKVNTGHSRRHFFEKRFAAAKARPSDFVHVGVVADNALRGFAIARIMHGEFGIKDAIAVVDALGVESENREHGFGQSLMEGLVEMARQRGARSVQSQVSWKNEDLLRFFKTSHFELAPRLALERPMTELREDEEEES